jgi:hypothetical protein
MGVVVVVCKPSQQKERAEKRALCGYMQNDKETWLREQQPPTGLCFFFL